MRNRLLRFGILGVAVSGCTVTMPAIARMDYSYALEAERTDNAMLVSEDEQSDVERTGMLALSFIETGPKLTADISSVAEHRDYKNDTFSDETWYYLNSDINWVIRPSSFIWVVQDYFSQQQLDTTLPSTPDNIIDTNVFSTGPDLFFRIDSVNQLGLGARYIDYRFDGVTADSRRASVNANWLYGLSASTELSLNVEHQDADFSEDESLNFTREDVYFRLNSQYSHSHFQVDIGGSRINRDAFEDVDGYLARLIWRNQFRASSYFQLYASSQYTDSGQDLLEAGSIDSEINRVGEQISGDIFRDERIEAAYRLGFSSSSYELQALYRDEDYEVSQQDRTTHGLRLIFDYIFSNRTNISAYAQLNEYERIDLAQTDEELDSRLVINYQIARNYTLRTEYSYRERESTVPGNEYTENRFLISFYYGRHPESYR